MFKKEPTNLDKVIDKLTQELVDRRLTPEETNKRVEELTALHKVKENTTSSVDKNVLITAVTNLLGILVILKHERLGNFIGSKALGFVFRLK